MCLSKPFPETILACNPRDYDFNPMYLLAQVYVQLANPIKSLEYLKKAQKFIKNPKDLNKLVGAISKLADTVKLVEKTITKAEKIKDKEKIRKLIDSLPLEAKQHPGISFLRNKHFTKTESSGKDLTIYCSQSVEEWTPLSMNTGIGGSEEAVIQLSKRLSNLGWNVTVYNSVISTQVFDNVTYRPYWEWNKDDKTDVFIGWRHAYVFSYGINATKKYLWLHDVPRTNEFDSVRVDNLDKIIVLSQYHRSLLPHVPDNKFFISSNGIDVEQFSEKVKKNPYKCIYTSAPDRGLETLLKLWSRIKEKVPQAELYAYYGWATYDKSYEGEKKKEEWKEKILKLLEQPGVMTRFERIGHNEIAKEMMESTVWVYPTEFPEISCIAGMKAQVASCVPVCTNFAALKETVQSGVKIDTEHIYTDVGAQNEFVNTVVAQLKKPEKIDTEKFKKMFNWDNVANSWNDEFNRPISTEI